MWRRATSPVRYQSLYKLSNSQILRYFGQYSATESELSEGEDVSTKQEITTYLQNEGMEMGAINTVFERFPEVTGLEVQRDIFEIVQFLKSQEFNVAHMLENNPLILDRDPKYMLQIMEFMTGIGMEGERLKDFIRSNPEFLTVEYKNLYWVKAFFEDELGFEEIKSILEEVPELALRTEAEVRSNADVIAQVGLNVSEVVDNCPWLLVTKDKQLKQTVQFMFDLVGIQQKRVFTLCPELLDYEVPNLEAKVSYLHNAGHNVRNILLNEPGVFQATLEELQTSSLDAVLTKLVEEQEADEF